MPSVTWTLYAVGIAVMLLAMTSDRVDGLAAIAVWFGGLAIFVVGIVLEERGYRV